MNRRNSGVEHFDRLCEACFGLLHGNEQLTVNLAAEDQQYLRFNHSKVRQSTAVAQRRCHFRFQSSGRRVTYSVDLTGDVTLDIATARSLIERGREEVRVLPEDPFVTPIENHGRSDEHHVGHLPEPEELLRQVSLQAGASDLAGLYAGGSQLRASRNSEGLRHVFSTESFFFDYSLFTRNTQGENKAVKALYSGRQWDDTHFADSLQQSRARLDMLQQESHSLSPGNYRVFFSPAAVQSLLSLFSWGAVSYGAWKKGDSALKRLVEGELQLSPLFSLAENFNLGLTPRFNSLGEVAPEKLAVIEQGVVRQLLINSRTAREFGVNGNGAESGEGLRSPEIASGDLEEADVLSALGTGLYVSNLHYLNWSDLLNARITGMTRYACFWVENGEIVAPIRDLRFDESLYRVFGSELEAITRTSQIMMNTDTYIQRSLGGSKVPGLMVRDFRFTL